MKLFRHSTSFSLFRPNRFVYEEGTDLGGGPPFTETSADTPDKDAPGEDAKAEEPPDDGAVKAKAVEVAKRLKDAGKTGE